ncbi:MAG: Flp pilus assembly complex ATPase component [Proteobacteria bacterium]|nr:Flp pilus assembly complex ATPase component [Pseudomonadota bacterium]MCP4917517.1 Flp pilus assembly complex ATPase component [Pseudomonadota bacterium]
MRVVAIAGARDGVGKSTLAANLALSLLKETRGRVLVLDMDVESCGDIVSLLGMDATPPKTLADFAPHFSQMTSGHLRGYIGAHPAGIGVLPLATPDRVGEVGAEHVGRLLELLSPLCDYIVADCGVGVNDLNVKLLEQSAGLFVVSTPDISALKHTRRFLDRLQRLQFPKELMKVVLNRHVAKGGVPLDLVSRSLGRKVFVALSEDAATVQPASLEGKPFVWHAPRATLSRMLDKLVQTLVEGQHLEKMARVARPQGVSGIGKTGRIGNLSEAQVDELATYQKKRGSKAKDVKQVEPRTAIKMLLHKRMVEVIDLKKMDGDDEVLRERVTETVNRLVDEVGSSITDRGERQRVVKEVIDEALGLGPLEDFLEDDRVTEIMVNRADQIYVEMDGKLTLTKASFTDDAQLLGVIERIVAPIGRRIDEKSPMVDARLKDGSRVNAVIPPLALDGPSITIRKFAREPFVVKDLVRFGTFTPEVADFLRACVQARLNILISGGTGTGKTTLLNVMSSFIPLDDRIVTVEDSAELQLKQPHVVRMETRPPNIEGEGAVTIRDLVRNSLRMRPDRIVVGECRGSEAVDMLQAMNTGHDGSLTTIHSNSPRDCLARLETLVMFAGLELPSRAIREQIGSAIQIIVQLSRLSDGSRRVTQISEITGMEGQVITLQDIFTFKQEGVDENGKVIGRFLATGFVPRFVKELEALGIALPQGIFATKASGVPRGRR